MPWFGMVDIMEVRGLVLLWTLSRPLTARVANVDLVTSEPCYDNKNTFV